jgi:hypothetical protein
MVLWPTKTEFKNNMSSSSVYLLNDLLPSRTIVRLRIGGFNVHHHIANIELFFHNKFNLLGYVMRV